MEEKIILIENKYNRAEEYNIPTKYYLHNYEKFSNRIEIDITKNDFFIHNDVICIHKSILQEEDIIALKNYCKNSKKTNKVIILFTGNCQFDNFGDRDDYCELKDTTFYNLLSKSLFTSNPIKSMIEDKLFVNLKYEENEVKYIDSAKEQINIFFNNVNSKSLLLYDDCLNDFEFSDLIYTRSFIFEDILYSKDQNIDTILFNELKGIKEIKNIERIFITIKFSKWYSHEYIGLRFIHLIRLKYIELEIKQNIPIYLISHLSEFELLKNTELANILLTPNVFRVNFENRIEYYESNLYKDSEVRTLLIQKLQITPPSNLENSHSRENYYAINEWKQALNLKKENIYDLFFILSQYKFPVDLKVNEKHIIKFKKNEQSKENEQNYNDSIKGKLLIIENELNNSWKDIYCKLFENSYIEIDFLYLENNNFNNIKYKKLEDDLKQKIENFMPNFILLDFRLLDIDNDEIKIENISGFKLLKLIKEINFGIHVFLTSVTSKAINLEKLYKLGLNGYIQKRFGAIKSPIEILYEYLKNYQSIKDISDKYKEVTKTFNTISKYITSYKLKEYDVFYVNEFKTYTYLSIKSLIFLHNKDNNSKNFNVEAAFILAFIALESLSKFNESHFKENGDISNKETTSNEKILNIFRTVDSKQSENYINEIKHKRNDLIHKKRDKNMNTINISDLYYLYDIIAKSELLFNTRT